MLPDLFPMFRGTWSVCRGPGAAAGDRAAAVLRLAAAASEELSCVLHAKNRCVDVFCSFVHHLFHLFLFNSV